MIPIYAAVFCVGLLLMFSFWITVFGSSQFLLFVGEDSDLIYDFLPTMPVVCMVIEYPFNMIQVDWPMLIFVELLFTVYILIDFLNVATSADH